MHRSIFHHRSHLLARGLQVLAQHKAGTSVAVCMACVLLVAHVSQWATVNRQSPETYLSQWAIANRQSLVSGTTVVSSESVKPFTRLDDPHDAHEYERRTQDILTHLDLLKNQTRADRVYAVSYTDGLNRFGTMVKISNTFEIGQIDELVPVSFYQDFSRMSWLYFRQYQTMISGLYPPGEFPQGYGTELYDHDGKAIGYLGIDYQRGLPRSPVNEITLLQKAAVSLNAAFLEPLDQLKHPGVDHK